MLCGAGRGLCWNKSPMVFFLTSWPLLTDLLPVPVPGVSTSNQVLQEELSPMQCWRKCLHPSQRLDLFFVFFQRLSVSPLMSLQRSSHWVGMSCLIIESFLWLVVAALFVTSTKLNSAVVFDLWPGVHWQTVSWQFIFNLANIKPVHHEVRFTGNFLLMNLHFSLRKQWSLI